MFYTTPTLLTMYYTTYLGMHLLYTLSYSVMRGNLEDEEVFFLVYVCVPPCFAWLELLFFDH